MSYFCKNYFFAYSKSQRNLYLIEDFFERWSKNLDEKIPIRDYDSEREENSIDCYFESEWAFPLKEMNSLYYLLPDKEDLFMRCSSLEGGCDYIIYYVCTDSGWQQF